MSSSTKDRKYHPVSFLIIRPCSCSYSARVLTHTHPSKRERKLHWPIRFELQYSFNIHYHHKRTQELIMMKFIYITHLSWSSKHILVSRSTHTDFDNKFFCSIISWIVLLRHQASVVRNRQFSKYIINHKP